MSKIKLKQLLIPASLFLFTVIFYGLMAPPGVTFEDAGYFLSSAMGGGYAHPPGYPLYTLLLLMWSRTVGLLFPNPAIGGSALSIVLSGLAIALFYRVLLQFFEKTNVKIEYRTKVFAALIALNMVVCFEFIEQSLLIEVYALHCILLMILYVSLIQKKYLLVGLATGLALSNHSTAIFFFAFTLFWLLLVDQRQWPYILKNGLKLFLPGCLIGLLPYLYLPLIAESPHPLQWGDPSTWAGFKEIVFRTNYWKVPASSLATQWNQIQISLFAFIEQWGWGLPVLFFATFSTYFIKTFEKRKTAYWHLVWIIQVPVMAILANMSLNDEGIKLVSVFFIPAYFFSLVSIGIFFQQIFEQSPKEKTDSLYKVFLFLLAFNFGFNLIKNYSKASMAQYSLPKISTDQIKSVLGTDKKAIVFTWNDFAFTPLIYEKYVNNDFKNVIPIPNTFLKDLGLIQKYQKLHKLKLGDMKKAVTKFYRTRPPGHIGVIEDKDFLPAFYSTIKNWLSSDYRVFMEYKINKHGFERLYFAPRGPFFEIFLNKPAQEAKYTFLSEPQINRSKTEDIWHKKFFSKYAENSILKALLNKQSPLKDQYLQEAIHYSKNTESEKKVRDGILKYFPNFLKEKE